MGMGFEKKLLTDSYFLPLEIDAAICSITRKCVFISASSFFPGVPQLLFFIPAGFPLNPRGPRHPCSSNRDFNAAAIRETKLSTLPVTIRDGEEPKIVGSCSVPVL